VENLVFIVDWHDLFAVDTSLMELAICGTIIYLSLFALLRLECSEAPTDA
jgi:hypothetical protein